MVCSIVYLYKGLALYNGKSPGQRIKKPVFCTPWVQFLYPMGAVSPTGNCYVWKPGVSNAFLLLFKKIIKQIFFNYS